MSSTEILTLKPNLPPKSITEITGAHEQQMYELLQRVLPTSRIRYESYRFVVKDDNGEEHSTIPDFIIEKPDGRIIHIEVTTAELNGTDPKAKQKEVMRHFPDIFYVVLYGQHLLNIQNRRGTPLIGARRIKEHRRDRKQRI